MRILHLFNWNLKDINCYLEQISEQGFEAIQINPIQPLKEDGNVMWWMSYQPCGFRIGNQYGSKEDLIKLCSAAKDYNIAIISDVVLNHVAGRSDKALCPHEKVDECLKNNPYFWKRPEEIKYWENRNEVITKCLNGLPGLNLCNYDLQDIIIKFLNELIDCGVSGFRFDAAKNIALPEEGCDFWPRVLRSLKKNDLFLYGEVIFANNDLQNSYSRFFNVLSETTCCNKNNAVSFVESHDSFYNLGDLGYTKNTPSYDIANKYYDLTNQFEHTLFFARPFDNTWCSQKVKDANYRNRVYMMPPVYYKKAMSY